MSRASELEHRYSDVHPEPGTGMTTRDDWSIRCAKAVRAIATMAILSLAFGCAGVPERRPVNDPLTRINCGIHRGNSVLDRRLIRPVARTYARGDNDGLPGMLRRRVRNFFTNLRGPIDISNNVLQAKLKRGLSGVGRLLVNTTIGLGGLFDPAARWGMPRYPEDFGQTLATWGVPTGPYLVLPVFGPSSARDLAGILIDWHFDPVVQHQDHSERAWLYSLRLIDARAGMLSRDYIRQRQYDEYRFLRGNYERETFDEAYFDGNAPPDLSAYFRSPASAELTTIDDQPCEGIH